MSDWFLIQKWLKMLRKVISFTLARYGTTRMLVWSLILVILSCKNTLSYWTVNDSFSERNRVVFRERHTHALDLDTLPSLAEIGYLKEDDSGALLVGSLGFYSACIDEKGALIPIANVSYVSKCVVLYLHVQATRVVFILGSEQFLQEDSPPTVLLLEREGSCKPIAGTISLLMHPRVYWVMTETSCFGDSFMYTDIVPAIDNISRAKLRNIRTKVLNFANTALPLRPEMWSSWLEHLWMTNRTISSKSIHLGFNDQYTQMLIPRREALVAYGKVPHYASCNSSLSTVPSTPFNVQVDSSCNHHWIGRAMAEVLENSELSQHMILSTDLEKTDVVIVCLKYNSRNGGKFQNLTSHGKLIVLLSDETSKNRGMCGAINMNSWSTSDCMDKDTGVPLPLEPKIVPLVQANASLSNTVLDTKKYLATFMGTHYKDRGALSFGIIRHILSLLDEEESGFVVYTHCHLSHKEKACKGAMERERLVAFSQHPSFDYRELLQESQYCLVPKGRQPASYRFLEAVLHGCVPVYLSDPGDDFTYSFALSSFVPWDKMVLYVHGRSVADLKGFLQSISEQEWLERSRFVRKVGETYFQTTKKIAKFLLLEVLEKIAGYNHSTIHDS